MSRQTAARNLTRLAKLYATGGAQPNGRARMRYSLEQLQRCTEVIAFLREQSALRT